MSQFPNSPFNPNKLQNNPIQPDRFTSPTHNSQIFTDPASIHSILPPTRQKIKKWTFNRQTQNYLYFIQPKKFIQFTQHQRLQYFKENNNELVMHYLLDSMNKRQFKVEWDILTNKIQIHTGRQNKKSLVKSFQEEPKLPQMTEQELKLHEQQLRRRHQQIIRQQRKQRARLERLKQKETQLKKQNQQRKFQEEHKTKEEMKRNQSQIITKKLAELKEKRQKQLQIYQERNKDYSYIVKSWAKSQVTHENLEKQFSKRYDSLMEEERKKIQSQRARFSVNVKVEDLKIKEHADKYLKWRSDNQAIRAAKVQEQQRMIEMYQKQLKKIKKYKGHQQKSNSDNNLNQDSDDSEDQSSQKKKNKDKTYNEIQEEKRQKALQKRRKMETYWQSFVKEEKQPKIDPKKQQQLQNLIQSLENARRMRKVKNQKGEYVYEQLKLSDPTLKGIQYLQYSRQLGRMRKSLKRKDSIDDKSSIHEENQRKKRSVDYLKQLRESRSSSMNNSSLSGMKKKLSFLENRELSFHEKLDRVERETFKLEQLTKNSENQLKYGKFKTSEEILQYKEDIDNNHIEILKMKLKLATNGKN